MIPDIGKLLSYLVFELFLPLMFTVAFVVFIWGSFQYFIAGAHDEEAREKGKSVMFYGLLMFALMVIIWAVLRLFINALT